MVLVVPHYCGILFCEAKVPAREKEDLKQAVDMIFWISFPCEYVLQTNYGGIGLPDSVAKHLL